MSKRRRRRAKRRTSAVLSVTAEIPAQYTEMLVRWAVLAIVLHSLL